MFCFKFSRSDDNKVTSLKYFMLVANSGFQNKFVVGKVKLDFKFGEKFNLETIIYGC